MTEREQIRLDIKKRLNSYRGLTTECQQIRDELERLEVIMSSPTSSSLDGMPRSPGTGNPIERMVAKKFELQDLYWARVADITEAQAAIEAMIDTLEPTERRLARYRYIDGLTWENVCDKLCYSWKQTHRIHGRMLDKLTAAEIERRKANAT